MTAAYDCHTCAACCEIERTRPPLPLSNDERAACGQEVFPARACSLLLSFGRPCQDRPARGSVECQEARIAAGIDPEPR